MTATGKYLPVNGGLVKKGPKKKKKKKKKKNKKKKKKKKKNNQEKKSVEFFIFEKKNSRGLSGKGMIVLVCRGGLQWPSRKKNSLGD